mmetsp:Transcript_75620/g.219613  ORF Transcript_75620/g.219613 Transcript_75620/m.219613 type:complete len:233 (-) Transcript_75620:111-809(-)
MPATKAPSPGCLGRNAPRSSASRCATAGRRRRRSCGGAHRLRAHPPFFRPGPSLSTSCCGTHHFRTSAICWACTRKPSAPKAPMLWRWSPPGTCSLRRCPRSGLSTGMWRRAPRFSTTACTVSPCGRIRRTSSTARSSQRSGDGRRARPWRRSCREATFTCARRGRTLLRSSASGPGRTTSRRKRALTRRNTFTTTRRQEKADGWSRACRSSSNCSGATLCSQSALRLTPGR